MGKGAVSFTHYFFGIKTSALNAASYLSVLIGVLYAAAGLLILTLKRRAAVAVCAARGSYRWARRSAGERSYRTDTAKNTPAIIGGTTIAAVFAVYIALQRRSYSA